jgi:hypothetical protein
VGIDCAEAEGAASSSSNEIIRKAVTMNIRFIKAPYQWQAINVCLKARDSQANR